MQTNRERFLESLINREHTVCGRVLRPLSLWHMINLRRVGVAVRRVRTRKQLLLAIAICATEPMASPAEMAPRIPEGKYGVENELLKFRAYVRDYLAAPRRMDGDGEPVQAPLELAIAARLMRYGHMTWHEALAFPFGLALWLSAALGEANGGDPGLLSEADEKARQLAGLEEYDDAG